MRISKIVLLLSVLVAGACTPTPEPVAAPPRKPAPPPSGNPFDDVAPTSISYFKGNALLTSSDGRIIYGLPKVAMMRRAVVPRDNRIVEEVISEVGSFILVLSGKPRDTVFEAKTPSGRKIGRVEFDGAPFSAHRWTYLSDAQPPKLLLSAQRSLSSLRMTSRTAAADSSQERLTTWDLTEISRERYQRLRQELIAQGIFRNETPEWDLPGS